MPVPASMLIRAKKLSPVEYVTTLLARIEHYDANYKAFIATGMERHLQRLPRGMLTAQEPAHVYRAKGDTP